MEMKGVHDEIAEGLNKRWVAGREQMDRQK